MTAPGLAPHAVGLHHVGVLVASFDDARDVLAGRLGMAVGEPEPYPHLGIEVLWLDAGGPPIELVRPIDLEARSAALLRAGRGGVHHVAIEVRDIDAALRDARAAGVRLVDAVPRRGTHDSRIAFIDAADAGGVAIELVEPARSPSA